MYHQINVMSSPLNSTGYGKKKTLSSLATPIGSRRLRTELDQFGDSTDISEDIEITHKSFVRKTGNDSMLLNKLSGGRSDSPHLKSKNSFMCPIGNRDDTIRSLSRSNLKSFANKKEEDRKTRAEESARKHKDARDRAEAHRNEQIEMLETQAKLQQDKRDKVGNERVEKKKEVPLLRTGLWLQAMCAITPLNGLVRAYRENNATATLRILLLPTILVWLNKRRCSKRLAALLSNRSNDLERPTPDTLKKLEFFDGWQRHMLETVSRELIPQCYSAGDYICREGDAGDRMFIFGSGAVDIYVRSATVPTKSRSIDNSIKLATISPDNDRSYFGEFTVLCNEPRSATCYCPEDCNLWTLDRQTVSKIVSLLRPRVLQKLIQRTDVRRALNMEKLYPLQPSQLRNGNKIFKSWETTQLKSLCKHFTPLVLRAGRTIIQQGDQGDALYFVLTGSLTVTKKQVIDDNDSNTSSDGFSSDESQGSTSSFSSFRSQNRLASPTSPSRNISSFNNKKKNNTPVRIKSQNERKCSSNSGGLIRCESAETVVTSESSDIDGDPDSKIVAILEAGDVFGQVSIIFSEPRCATVTCRSNCELWKLERHSVMDFLMADPQLFIECKEITNTARAQWLPSCSVSYLNSPLLASVNLPKSFYKQLVAWLTPLVVDMTSIVIQSGSDNVRMICLTRGTIVDPKTQNKITAPAVIGLPEVLTGQPYWAVTYKAVTMCEMWCATPQVLLSQIKQSGYLHVVDNEAFHDKLLATCFLMHKPYTPLEVNIPERDPCSPCSPCSPVKSFSSHNSRLSMSSSSRVIPSRIRSPTSPLRMQQRTLSISSNSSRSSKRGSYRVVRRVVPTT